MSNLDLGVINMIRAEYDELVLDDEVPHDEAVEMILEDHDYLTAAQVEEVVADKKWYYRQNR